MKAKTKSGYIRTVSATAVLVPLAAVAAGMNLGNHNETGSSGGIDVKSTIDSVKARAGSGYIRAISASAVLVPLALVLGGTRLPNHNENVVRHAA